MTKDSKLKVHLQSGGSFNGYLLGFSCGHTIHDSVVSLSIITITVVQPKNATNC